MCDGNVKCAECNKRAAENFGGSSVSQQPIGEFFEQNKEKIAEVFMKHGADDIPVTPLYAGMLFKVKGKAFAEDMAPIFHPDIFSNYNPKGQEWHNKRHLAHQKEIVEKTELIGFDDDKAQEAIGITGNILAGLGAMGIGIAHTMGHKKAIETMNQAPGPVCPPGQRPDQQGKCVPDKPKERLYFGFKPIHIGLFGLLLVGAVVFFLMSDKPKVAVAAA